MRISDKTYAKYKTMYWEDHRNAMLELIKGKDESAIADDMLELEWQYVKNTYVNAMRKLEKQTDAS